MTGTSDGHGPAETHEEEPPPVLGTWPRLYGLVLAGLLLEIVLFYLVTRTFS